MTHTLIHIHTVTDTDGHSDTHSTEVIHTVLQTHCATVIHTAL